MISGHEPPWISDAAKLAKPYAIAACLSMPQQVEDKLLEVVRQMETGVEGMIDQIMPSMPGSRPASQEVGLAGTHSKNLAFHVHRKQPVSANFSRMKADPALPVGRGWP